MKVNIAPAKDRARMIADPFVYFGPSVLGNRYPDPMLRSQRDELEVLSPYSRDCLRTSYSKGNSNRSSRFTSSIVRSPGDDQRCGNCAVSTRSAKWYIGKLTIVTGFGQNKCSKSSGMIGGRYAKVDGEAKDLA